MKGKTHSTEEIIRILRQADGGETAQSICREHNISEQTFYRSRIQLVSAISVCVERNPVSLHKISWGV